MAEPKLPEGAQMVEAFDLAKGGLVYYVTGPIVPRLMSFKGFKTRDEAMRNALEYFASLPQPQGNNNG